MCYCKSALKEGLILLRTRAVPWWIDYWGANARWNTRVGQGVQGTP